MNSHNALPLLLTCLFCSLVSVRTKAQTHSGSGEAVTDLVKYEWNKKIGNDRIEPYYYMQDSRGLMWIATSSGPVSFDGYNFKRYDAEVYRLSASRTFRLAEDINGQIWIIGIRNSRIVVDVMNPGTEISQPLHQYLGLGAPVEIPLREEIVMLYNISGNIWLGTPDLAFLYDGRWQQIYTSQPGRKSMEKWLPAPEGGMWKFYQQDAFIRLENSRGVVTDSVPRDKYVWLDDKLDLWMGPGSGGGLYTRLTARSGRVYSLKTDKTPVFNWFNQLLCPHEDYSARLYGYDWTVSGNDVLLKPEYENGVRNLTRQFPGAGARNRYFFDREGGIWTADFNTIIRISANRNSRFRTFLANPDKDCSVRGMIQQGDWLYVNTYKGEYRVRLDNYSIVEKVKLMEREGLTFLAEKDGFWVGGLWGKIARFQDGKRTANCDFRYKPDILSLLQDGDGVLAGTSSGLLRVGGEGQSAELHALPNIEVDYLYRNDKGIWACTTNGLYLLDEQGNEKGHFLEPGSTPGYTKITHLCEDTNGDFWITTWGAGIIRWSQERGIISHFTKSEGLSSNDIHAVYDDGKGCLWLPGNYGLMRLQKETGKIQAYFKRDGIADNEFNAMSHFRSADGTLFFGGTNGVTAFHPDDIPLENAPTHRLRLMEVRTFRVKSAAYTDQMTEFDAGRPVTVSPDDDYLDVRVSPCLYEDVNQIRYSWKIEGYSEDWVQQQSPQIRLYNLPYGKYTLHVRYSMHGNIWSENELYIPLVVTRPFYLQWYFFLFTALVLAAGTWIFTNWRTRQLLRDNIKLEEEVANRTQQIEKDKAVIEQQARELRSLDELKSRFFANITHELRTPLTLILGPIEKIIKSADIGEKNRESALMVKRNAIKLLNLVEELLDLSRIEANKLVLIEKPVRLYPFLARILSMFTPYYEHRGIELRITYDCPSDLVLLMDAQKWEKIINNLLNNAIKFTSGGGMVQLEATMTNQELIISVTDTGNGIHADDLPHIFDRYYQARSLDQTLQGGAGIGLSLCREYMRLFGGEIIVQSTPGKGSKFTLRCPLKLAPHDEPEQQVPGIMFPELPEALPVPLSGIKQKKTILMVEDDRDMSGYIQEILQDEYNVIAAENGLKALPVLDKISVDLILSDVMMPGMDGFQLLKTVRDRHLDIPFIMLTARADAPDRLNALTLGVDDYLTKPFLEEELKVRLSNLIGRYEARKAAQKEDDSVSAEDSFDQKWLKQLEEKVLENIGNPDYSLDELAEQMAMSRRNLYNKVQTCTGMTPNQYLTEARLNKARHLIESKAYNTMAEVCYAVGMKTPYYFSRLMKERFGKEV